MPDMKGMEKVREADIVLGIPIPWAAYDAEGRLLLNRGQVVHSMNQVRALLDRGLYRRRLGGPLPSRSGGEETVQVSGSKTEETISFEDLGLTPGDIIQLQPLKAGSTEPLAVRLVGYVKGKSILVTAPEAGGKILQIADGQTFQGRAFSGLSVGAFSIKVLKSQFSPYPYMHMSYPVGIQAMRLRQAVRATVELPVVAYDQEGGKQVATGIINDISAGGIRVVVPKVIGRKDQTIFVSFPVKIGDIEDDVKTSAVVRSIVVERDAQDQPRNIYGLQFEELSLHHRLLIMNLVHQHI